MDPLRLLILCLGLVLNQMIDAAPAPSALELDLTRVEQVITETQAEFQTALAGHDQESLRTLGNRLRELKLRRERIAQNLAAARETQHRQEAETLQRRRSVIVGELEALAAQIEQAAAAFKQRPDPAVGARLRDLTLREIELRNELATADTAATEGSGKAGAVTATPGQGNTLAPNENMSRQ